MLHRTVVAVEPEQATQDGGSYLRLLQLRQIFAGCLLKGFYADSEYGAGSVDVVAENIAYKNAMTLDYTNGINYYDQYFKQDFVDITAGNDHQLRRPSSTGRSAMKPEACLLCPRKSTASAAG